MGGVKALRRIQLAKEAVAGTEIQIATALWRGTGVFEDRRETVFAPEDVGYISGVDRTYVPKVLAALAMEETPATFEQILYMLNAGVKSVTTGVADGAGSGKIYTFTFPTTAKNTLKTFCLQAGDDQEVEFATYGFAEAFRLSGRPGEALMMSSDWLARQLARNTYTATTIAFVAATKKITDSANGLAGFLTGDRIKVTGSANNDGTYTIATGGVAGEIVVTETLADEAASPSITLDETFTAVALPTVEEVLFSKGKLYLDAIGGTIGTTQKANTLLGADLSVKTGWFARFTGDGNLYFSSAQHSRENMELLLSITFEHDGSATAEKAFWRSQTARLLRLQFQGNALATPGTTYTYKTVRIDLAGKWEKFDKLGEQDGNDIIAGTFRARYDSTAAKFAEIMVINELATLT